MKNLLTFVLFISLTYTAQAQGKIAVQEDSVTVAFYTDLATALDSAAPNSTVYLPGGGFILSTSYIINKPLNIVGVGYNTDSTQATNQTVLPQIYFGAGSEGSTLTGCYITSWVYITSSTSISNISVKRCSFDKIYMQNASNIVVTENIIRNQGTGSSDYSIRGHSNSTGASTNLLISKNIVRGKVQYITQSVFNNNIFNQLTNSNVWYFNISSCVFKDNYFSRLYANSSSYISSSIFNNNAYQSLYTGTTNPTNIFNNNLTSSTFANTFEEIGGIYNDTYYQIKSTSPAKNYGTDGTDIGIFGTTKPWKIGGLPDNPHVYFINVADENTGANGTLPVEIGVSGQ
jgi:hypothetical protein